MSECCRGFTCARKRLSTARGVAGRDMVDCACGEVAGGAPRVSSQTKLEVSVAHTRRRCPSGSVATKV